MALIGTSIQSLAKTGCQRHEHHAPAVGGGPAEVGERGHRVVEEHDAEAAEHHVEAAGGERVDLGVGLLERDVGEPALRRRLGSGRLHHGPADVDPQRGAGAGLTGGGAGHRARAAADVEHALAGRHPGGLEHGRAVGGEGAVVAGGVRDPVVARRAVPHGRHVGVGRGDAVRVHGPMLPRIAG